MSGAARILRGPVLSPVAPDRADAWPDGFVAIDAAGRIEAAGPWAGRPDGIERSRPLVETSALVLPAFVDAHVHLPQIDVRGRWGLPLLPWLETVVFPAEAAFADPDHAAEVAARFFAALAEGGVGAAAVFATVHREATGRALEAAAASGLRVALGNVLMDRGAPAELLAAGEDGVAATLALAERWEGAAGGRVAVAMTPRFALSCSPELLASAGAAAASAGLRVQTHLAENVDEVAAVAAEFPGVADYLAVYERAGLVGERTILAHAIHCSDGAFGRIAAAGAGIACCPSSNAFLGSGAFPLARARASGATIAVGSDVGAGPQLSPLDALRHLAYLGGATPAELLWRGTAAGAAALGWESEHGRIAPGLAADLVLLEPPRDPGAPPDDLIAAFARAVFRSPEARVVATLVEGRVVHGALPEGTPFDGN